jgi:hypothetical protein
MSSRVFCGLLFVALSFAAYAQDRTQAELRFVPASSVEKNAGVWVDGHYVGCVKELKGRATVRLLPGRHEIVVRQPWYRDYFEEINLEPGAVHKIELSLSKLPQKPTAAPGAAELKISVIPIRAAVFVDDQFVGHSDEFDGLGQGLLVSPGKHKMTIALPGYLPFETELSLSPHQKLRVSTTLTKGTTPGALVSPAAK